MPLTGLTRGRNSLEGRQISLAERVRKLEVMNNPRVVTAYAPTATNDELDVLTEIVTLLGAWNTSHSENFFQGAAIGYTAREMCEDLWESGWFGGLREYVAGFPDGDPEGWASYPHGHKVYIDPDPANPYVVTATALGIPIQYETGNGAYIDLAEPAVWREFWMALPDDTGTPWGALNDGFTNFYATGLASQWTGLLLDTGAIPELSQYSPARPKPSSSRPGERGMPLTGAPFWSWLVGGQIGQASGTINLDVSDSMSRKILYFTGLPAVGGDIDSWQYMLKKATGNEIQSAKAGCPGVTLPDSGSSSRPWHGGAGYDPDPPYGVNSFAWGRPPGGYLAYHGGGGNDYMYYTGFNGIYDECAPAPGGGGGGPGCPDYRVCSNTSYDGGLAHWGGIPGQPLGPFVGMERCPLNPTGHYTAGCTGVMVSAAFIGPADVSLLVPPQPIIANAAGQIQSFDGNYHAGLGALPDITYPTRATLRARIAGVISRYPGVLWWLRNRLGSIEDAGSQYDLGRKRFPQDGVWTALPMIAPWRGRIEARFIGRRVEFRGYAITHGKPREAALAIIPPGFPTPHDLALTGRDLHVVAAGPYPDYPVGDFHRPGATNSQRKPETGAGHGVVTVIGRTSAGKPTTWFLTLANNNAGSGNPIEYSSGLNVVSLDGIGYVAMDDSTVIQGPLP